MKKVLFLTIFILIIFSFCSFAAGNIIDVGLFYGNTVLPSLDLASADGLEAPEMLNLGTS